MPPRLSVTVLNYNYGHYLTECVDSILGQTFADLELIIIDDASSDNSVEIACKYAADQRVRIVAHQENQGFSASLIEGTENLSQGEFLTVVSADDFLAMTDAFERQIALLDRSPDSAFAFMGFEIVRPTGTELHRSFERDTVLQPRQALHEIALARGVWPAHSGTVIRASSYRAAGGYRRDLAMPLDLALWFDLSMQGGFCYVDAPGQSWRLHGEQMSTSKARLIVREISEVVAASCEEGERLGFETKTLTRAAIGAHLGAFAITEAFGGDRRVALVRCWASIRESPVPALTNKRMWIAIVRAIGGDTGFKLVRRARTWLPGLRHRSA